MNPQMEIDAEPGKFFRTGILRRIDFAPAVRRAHHQLRKKQREEKDKSAPENQEKAQNANGASEVLLHDR